MLRLPSFLRLLFVFLACLAARAPAADAAAYDRSLAAGRALAEKGSYPEAFAELQRAVAADPVRFEGYFELAVVSYRMGNFSAAEDYAKLALAKAPEARQAEMKEMLGVIEEKRGFEKLERDGDEAFGNGLMAKAAESYRKAYLLFPQQGKVGLRAAEIYAETLNRLIDAAVLWQKIAVTADAPSAAAAREALGQHRSDLDRLAATRLAAAKQAGNTDQMLQLTEAFPQQLELRLELAAAFAAKRDAANTVRQLVQANKLGLKANVVMKRPEFFALLESEGSGGEFTRFLEDAFGGEIVTGLREEGQGAVRAARAEAEQKERAARSPVGKNYRVAPLALDLIWIAPGTFQMGSTDGNDDERPVTRVTLSRGFWLGKTEVTQAQWQEVMGNNPSTFQGATRPVEHVSWDEAMQFCERLSERERAAGRLPEGYGYTLPTEAQWEYACRAGTTGRYAGDLDAMGWYSANSGSQTQPVARKQANAWGLHDMHGNVWEWCLDRHGNYPGGSVTDPSGASSGSGRVFRGGCFFDSAVLCRSAGRLWNVPGGRFRFLGFRLALSFSP